MSSAFSAARTSLRTPARPALTVVTERPTFERVGIVGLGYVGLPTALAFAAAGRSVVGFDISESRLADIKAGRVDLLPSDHERLNAHLTETGLCLTTEAGELATADAVIVCVPTPVDEHLVPDLNALAAACNTVVEAAVPGQVLILTSTTYVGSTRDLLVSRLEARGLRVGTDIFVAFSPERIDPGQSDHIPEHTPRVLGGVTAECAQRAVAVLSDGAPMLHVVSSPEAAELTKLVENTFRAVNIALANEFATAARTLDLDVMEVIRAAATKPYGFMPFYPGAGVGGHCIPCDPHYLLWQLRAHRANSPLVEAAMTAIAGRPRNVVAHARQMLGDMGQAVAGARVLVLGVAYKPGVADLRESPALEILDELALLGAEIAYSDPLIEHVNLPHAGMLTRNTEPETTAWDLVLVHTLDSNQDYGWLADCPAVLDTTYQLQHLPHRQVP